MAMCSCARFLIHSSWVSTWISQALSIALMVAKDSCDEPPSSIPAWDVAVAAGLSDLFIGGDCNLLIPSRSGSSSSENSTKQVIM
ncbi:hypothetical protein PGT21_029299 [Puccinia graminis f. sp. tritici]|uniref:Secreted protein n=1 Tax=Puccinia graminis f. sp. tritici TaxID=56615 RepID=A0A5B0QCF6_PUCGR|nr:hypothetical protein PGT21_029299 [Puccinia graminis f. sp. tritici]